MNYPTQPPKSPQIEEVRPANDILTQALGERQKLKQVMQKRGASYPPPAAPGKKVFSPRPDSVDL